MSENNLLYYQEIINKLKKLISKEYLLLAVKGLEETILAAVILVFFFSLIEFAGHFSSKIRTVFFAVEIILPVFIFVYRAVSPFIQALRLPGSRAQHYSAAEKVGGFYPAIKDELLNSMQLVALDKTNLVYSSGLIEAAFKQTYEKTKTIDFNSIINYKLFKKTSLYLLYSVLFCAALFSFVPGLRAASYRIMNYKTEFIPPARFTFEVIPGNSQVTKGGDVLIKAKIKGEKPKEVLIAVKSDEQTKYEYLKLTIDSAGFYAFEDKAVRSSFQYFFSADKLNSDEYRIEAIDRPNVRTLDVTVTQPAYSKQPQIQQKDNGNVAALFGSVVEVKLSATKNLKNAKILFSDTTSVNLQVNGRDAVGRFRVTGDKNYQFMLTDENGNTNQSPVSYSIKASYDAYPSIEIISPNKDVTLGEDNRLPLYVKISDDYGFSKLVVHYRLSSSKYEAPHKDFTTMEILIDRSKKENDVSYIWNLSPLKLATEDVITYYLEVYDNDNVSGPKAAKSGLFNARIPSLEELLKHADNVQNRAEKDLQQTLKEADELKKSMDKISQDLKQEKKELTWQEKEKIEKALDKFEKLQDKVDNISKQMDNMKNDLQKNNLLSKETLQKYMELQKMFKELSSDEMKKAMEQMQNALQKMDRQSTENSMQNMKIDEEQFQKSLERTINLLKRIQTEQKVDEAIKRMDEIAKKQDEIQHETKNGDLKNQQTKNELTKKQESVSKELDQLKEEMKELADKMKDLKDMPNSEMNKNLDELDKQRNEESSDEASQDISQNNKQKAEQNQSQVSKNMKQMKQKMQNMQKSMQQQNQQQTFSEMMKMLNNLISLSKKQEELKKQSQSGDQSMAKMNQNAQKQSDLKSELQRVIKQMSETAQKTFAISPEMGKSLGDAERQMDNAMDALQNKNGPAAAIDQGAAMKALNESASMMKGGMESMMQGGGQGGMMSMMQQLGKMSQMQMSLNNMTQALQQGMSGQGQMTPQQQSQMQRLAQEQQTIQKSLDELNKEAQRSGKSKSLPANLDNIMKQMQEVVADMHSEKIGSELIQKQERILSKLLDAQRSVNERDYEKERESKAGTQITKGSPADLNLSTERGKNRIKDELNKASQEGYLKDYEELIRKYYEALQKRNIKN
jgi:hypothetical protein